MYRALLKKQIRELNTIYFYSKKNGKRRTTAGIAGMVTLFVIVFLAVACMMFGFSMLLGSTLLEKGSDMVWVYFAMMGLTAIIFGTFGSVFNTYESMYKSKDNEMLLAMPVPTWMILSSRMFGVVLMSALYTSLVWIPAIIAAWMLLPFSAVSIIFHVLFIGAISAFVSVLTCLLGFVVAVCSTRLRNKSFTVVAISLVLFGGYYYVCFNLNSLLNKLAENAEVFGSFFKSKVLILYLLGKGCDGESLSALLFIAIVIVLFIAACFILSKSFVSIITAKNGLKSKGYKRTRLKSSSKKEALVKKELKHFLASSTYMLNAGLGIAIMPVAAIIGLVKSPELLGVIDKAVAQGGWYFLYNYIPVLILVAINMIIAMNAISASSISLEGKNLWIAQTIPVDIPTILEAKECLHGRLNMVPAVFTSIVLGIAFKCSVIDIAAITVCTSMYAWVTADLGLILNLNLPNLEWTNEAVPVKQSICVFIMLFGGWFIDIIMFVAYIPLAVFISGWIYMVILLAVETAAFFGMRYWIKNVGVQKFLNL